MSPKEKAKNILDKFGTFVVMWTGDVKTQRENIKQCALITVDEILKAREAGTTGVIFDESYWKEVKSELNVW